MEKHILCFTDTDYRKWGNGIFLRNGKKNQIKFNIVNGFLIECRWFFSVVLISILLSVYSNVPYLKILFWVLKLRNFPVN